MKIISTPLTGCFLIEPLRISDERGYFMESFNQAKFDAVVGFPVRFVQDNQSFSTQGILRGLHYQEGEFAQAKLVRVVQGTVLDVVVDLRPDSDTYKQWYAVELSADNHLQLFIPRGFAHGFAVLSETALFSYKCDNYYAPAAERGIRFDDPSLNIDWNIDLETAIVSTKDRALPYLKA